MVYERYIKKNGKSYGPYTYHSRKENGKVISEYRGKNSGSVKKSFSKYFLFALIGFALIFSLVAFVNFNLTGKVSLDVKSRYIEGETLEGNLKFSLKEGELIPEDIKLILQLGDSTNEFLLSDFVTLSVVEGSFYAEDTTLSGTGFGYGLIGSKKIYPDVNFDLEAINTDKTEEQIEEHVLKEEPSANFSERETNETENAISDEETTPEETPAVSEESQPSAEEIPAVGEDVVSNLENENQIAGETTEDSSTAKADEKANAKDSISGKEGETATKKEEKSAEKEKNGEEKKSSDAESSLMTGEVVSEFVISGVVSKGNDFEYDAGEEKIWKIIEGSARVGDEKIGESELKVKSKKNIAVVSTDYYIEEEGFGEDYIGGKKLVFNIDLEKFGLVMENSSLFSVKLFSDGMVLVEADKDLHVEELEINESELNETSKLNRTPANVILVNETLVNQTLSNVTLVNETILDITGINMTMNTSQYGAVLNMPVKWKKNVKIDVPSRITVELPKKAENITVYKFTGEVREEVEESSDESVDSEIEVNVLGVEENSSEFAPEINGTIEISANESVEKIESQSAGKTKVPITAKVISGEISVEIEEGGSFFIRLFNNIFKSITGKVVDIEEKADVKEVIIEENATEYDVEYETPGPVAFERDTPYGKEVVISSEIHYDNVLAYTGLPKEIPFGVVRLYWLTQENISITKELHEEVCNFDDEANETVCENVSIIEEICANETFYEERCNFDDEANETFCENVASVQEVCSEGVKTEIVGYEIKDVQKLVDITEYDWDNNSLVDYIEWVVPHLSNQTYEVILIAKAEHLDENRVFIENVYEQVKARDENWTLINDSHYLRVTFEKNLTNENDITIYARNENETAGVEVYLKDSDEVIAVFENITNVNDSFEKYQIFLTSLGDNESYSVFDLKSVGGVEYDYVVDPSSVMSSSRIYSPTNTTADPLQGFCNATDADADAVNYYYEWYKNDALFDFGSFSNYTGNATQVGYLSSNSLDYSRGVFVSGDYAYVASLNNDSLTIIDVSDKTAPAQVGSLSNSSSMDSARNVFVSGDYAYVTSAVSDSLTIINVSTKTAPTQVAEFENSSIDFARDVFVSGNYAYATGYNNDSLTIINISDVTSPTQVGYLTNSYLDGAYGVFVLGDYAYVTGNNNASLNVINISDVTSPTQVGQLLNSSSLTYAIGVFVSGDYAYVAGGGNNSLTIIDISTKTAPTQVGSFSNFTSMNYPQKVYVSGDYAYITGSTNDSLTIINISDVTSPTQVGFFKNTSLDGAYGVYVSGDYAYVTGSINDSLTILDIADSFPQGLEINVNNMSNNYLSVDDNWTLSCRAYDSSLWSSWLNSSALTIIVNPLGPPSANRFSVKNLSGDNVASIDDKGDMYLAGTASESQGSLAPSANSFIIQNSAGSPIVYFNETGFLFMLGAITQNSDLSGRTTTNMEIKNSTGDLVAFFDNQGNLKLQGGYGVNYASP